jgi:hypothetical protein
MTGREVADGLLVAGRNRGEQDQADQPGDVEQELLVEVRIGLPGLRQDRGQIRVGSDGRPGLDARAALPAAAQHGQVESSRGSAAAAVRRPG